MIPRVVLDTNALSDFADSEPAIMEKLADVQAFVLPVVVLGEYRFGIAQARNSADYHHWLTQLLTHIDVLNITDETTPHYAALRAELKRIGKPIPMNDLWIAAICRQHALAILSRDRHFDVVPGLKRIEW